VGRHAAPGWHPRLPRRPRAALRRRHLVRHGHPHRPFPRNLQLARTDLNATLRDEGRGLAGSRSRGRLRSLLVVGQVALSLLLLICAGLLVRSFDRLLHVDPGFDASNVLTMGISLPTEKYARPDQQTAFFDETIRRVSALPGVRNPPPSPPRCPLSFTRFTPVLPEGQFAVPLAQRPFIDIEAISPQWFETMRVPFLAGRTLHRR
jgi:putative ABC transport system permease protein